MFMTTNIGENLETIPSASDEGFFLNDMENWEKIFIYFKDVPELIKFLQGL